MSEEPEAAVTGAHDEAAPYDRGIGQSQRGNAALQSLSGSESEVPPSPRPNGWTATPAYVYAIGKVEPRFPTLSAEKEFAQATGRADGCGLADRQALHSVLSDRQNRYLVRQLCWVLTIEAIETYIITATRPERSGPADRSPPPGTPH